MDEKAKRKEKSKRGTTQVASTLALSLFLILLAGCAAFGWINNNKVIQITPTRSCAFTMSRPAILRENEAWTAPLQQRLDAASLEFVSAQVLDEAYEWLDCDDGFSKPLFASCNVTEITLAVDSNLIGDEEAIGNLIENVLKALGEETLCGDSWGGAKFHIVLTFADGELHWMMSGYYPLLQAYHTDGLRGQALYEIGTVE